MGTKSLSLQQYLRDRLVLLGLLLVIIYGVAMTTLYSWGLDDASEFYLFHDAKAAERDLTHGLPLPTSTAFKRYYYGEHNLPSEYDELKRSKNNNPLLSHMSFDNRFDYILQYPIESAQNKMLYVIHSFDQTTDIDQGISVIEIALIMSSIALISVLIMAMFIYRAISQPVNTLYRWGGSLSKASECDPLPPLRFKELQAVGSSLEESITNMIKISEREKSFVRCLSHELRTPMAVVSASLDILDNKEMGSSIKTKTKKIREANIDMIEISDTLLQIWLTEKTQFKKEIVDIHSFVDGIINDNLYVKNNVKATIDNKIPIHMRITIEKQPLSIILTNIVKNSLQYSSDGVVELTANEHCITVTNSIAPFQESNKDTVEYGFGLGLFIAEIVAGQQSWKLTCKQEIERFTSTLSIPKK